MESKDDKKDAANFGIKIEILDNESEAEGEENSSQIISVLGDICDESMNERY